MLVSAPGRPGIDATPFRGDLAAARRDEDEATAPRAVAQRELDGGGAASGHRHHGDVMHAERVEHGGVEIGLLFRRARWGERRAEVPRAGDPDEPVARPDRASLSDVVRVSGFRYCTDAESRKPPIIVTNQSVRVMIAM